MVGTFTCTAIVFKRHQLRSPDNRFIPNTCTVNWHERLPPNPDAENGRDPEFYSGPLDISVFLVISSTSGALNRHNVALYFDF